MNKIHRNKSKQGVLEKDLYLENCKILTRNWRWQQTNGKIHHAQRLEEIKMVMATLYAREQKRYRWKEQTSELCKKVRVRWFEITAL